jgi:hypothetical protein
VRGQRRVTYFIAGLAFVVGLGFVLAGIAVSDFWFLVIGAIEVLMFTVICAGRFHILRVYESVQFALKNQDYGNVDSH